jgi:glucose/mannose-6-phosphate isomerase
VSPDPELLDDLAAVAGADPRGMLAAVLGLGEQSRRGYAAGLAAEGLPSGDELHALVLCGMGGSGVAGDMIRALYRDRLIVPVDVVRDLVLPEHCDKDTIVVCSSYSGDTAETLTLFEEAARRGCRLLAVTAGGALANAAAEIEVPVVPVSGGLMPRAALGHLLLGTLGALEAIGVVPELDEDVEAAAATLAELAREVGPERPAASNEAKSLAVALQGRVPVVWGAEGIGAVAATRWKTDLNESAEVPAFASALPELDHNEVVGWSAGAGDGFAVVALRHEDEHPDVAARFPVSEAIARDAGALVREVAARGEAPLGRLLSLVLLGGAVSVYLGILRGVDPGPIANIDRVKRELAEA